MPTETSLGASQQRILAYSVNYGTPSTSRQLETTFGNCKVTLSSSSGTSDEITFTYTLEDDREATASIKPEYSTDGGATWSEGTKGATGDNKTGLTTSAAGTSHTFVWDTVTDLGIDAKQDILFRIRAYDQNNYLGSYLTSATLKVSVDNAPAQVVLVSPTDGYFDKEQTPTFVWTIADMVGGDSKAHFKIEFADNANFSNATVFESRNDQTGWQYDATGSGGWTDVPAAGVDIPSTPALVGRQARYTIQQENAFGLGTQYWRVTQGGVL